VNSGVWWLHIALTILLAGTILALGVQLAADKMELRRLSQPPDDPPKGAEKAAADWLYPGAKVINSMQTGAVSNIVEETADDAPKVLKHYGDRLGISLHEDTVGAGGKASTGGEFAEYAHVGRKQAGGLASVSTFRTKTAVATVVITRSQDGQVTLNAVSIHAGGLSPPRRAMPTPARAGMPAAHRPLLAESEYVTS
jgi:hypothetical protein